MKILLIGGYNDGKIWELDNFHEQIRVPVVEQSILHFDPSKEQEISISKYEIYKLEKFSTSKKVFKVYAAMEMTPEDIFETLINNYRPKESK